jgi:hypothetical protein
VALVESHLGQGPRNRPRHEVVDTFPLRDSPPQKSPRRSEE